jgi:hypothetical protein
MSSISDPRRKSVPLGVVLSGMLPGLGQVYSGYLARGIVIALVFVSFIGLAAMGPPHGIIPMLGLGIAFVYLFSLIDAGQCANRVNMAIDGIENMSLPKPGMQGAHGSIIGGVVLVFLGTAVLLSIHTDFTMDWFADWWPLGVVALGVYVFYQGWKGRRTA